MLLYNILFINWQFVAYNIENHEIFGKKLLWTVYIQYMHSIYPLYPSPTNFLCLPASNLLNLGFNPFLHRYLFVIFHFWRPFFAYKKLSFFFCLCRRISLYTHAQCFMSLVIIVSRFLLNLFNTYCSIFRNLSKKTHSACCYIFNLLYITMYVLSFLYLLLFLSPTLSPMNILYEGSSSGLTHPSPPTSLLTPQRPSPPPHHPRV